MANNKVSASEKFYRKEKKQQQKKSPRSPLTVKDVNVASSLCSSSTSISSEAPKGCLRFFLPNHSSNVSKYDKVKSFLGSDKTPKSAPNVKRFRTKISNNGTSLVEKGSNKQNPEKPSSKNITRLKENDPPCVNSCRSVEKCSSRYDLFNGLNILSCGSQDNVCENAFDWTPMNKIGTVYDDCLVKLSENETNYSDCTSSPAPPVQPSVSPEIQGASMSVVRATPNTCYAAGHVLSGISDKRKCKPSGILTIGNKDLFGSSKTKMMNSEDEKVFGVMKKRRDSLIPSPSEASICWLLSPCDEKRSEGQDEDADDKDVVRLNECEMSMPFNSIGCSSSPASSLGFSSELINTSSSTITTSDATTASHCSRSRSSEFRGFVGPSFDHMVHSLTSCSPVSVPSCEVEISPKHGKYKYRHEREATPSSEDSIGSGNVIQTPQSDSSSQNVDLFNLSRDEISRIWFECELDSVAEVLRRVSVSPECQASMVDSLKTNFEFDPLIRPESSIDFTLFRKVIDSQVSPEVPELMHGWPESEVKISWRKGLESRIFEMDELDCCRCFSDEEDDAIGCSDTFDSDSGLELPVVDSDNNMAVSTCEPPTLLQLEGSTKAKHEKSSPSQGTNPHTELSSHARSSDVPEDSNWAVCYKNDLFQL